MCGAGWVQQAEEREEARVQCYFFIWYIWYIRYITLKTMTYTDTLCYTVGTLGTLL